MARRKPPSNSGSYRIGAPPMPVSTPRTPAYRLHKPTGLAVVTLNGRDFYLGKHGSPESRSEYDRVVAEWLGSGRRIAPPRAAAEPQAAVDGPPSVNELLLAYLGWAD